MKKYILIFLSISIFSIHNIKAQVNGAILQGNSVTASGLYSSAIGNQTQATGLGSFAGGKESVATKNYTMAFGNFCQATGHYAISLGSASIANADNAISIGVNTTASGVNAMSFGQFVKATGTNSIALGRGYLTTELTNGIANSFIVSFNSTNATLFVGPNNSGVSTGTGNVGIATTAPGSKLQVNGNAAIGYSSSTAAPANGLMVKGLSNFDNNIKITTTNTLTSITDVSSSPGISIKQPVQKNYSIIDFKNVNETILSRIAVQEIRNQENNALQGGVMTFNILNSNNSYTKLLSLNNTGVLELGNPNATDFSIIAKSNMMLQRPNGNLHFTVDNTGNPRIYSSAYKTLKFFADGLWQLVEFNNIKSQIINATNINVFSEIVVQANAEEWKDCVFKQNYDLMPLNEVEQFVKTNQHFPEIPSALEIEKNGIPLKQMNALLLQKVEELTLYIIEQQKDIQQLKEELSEIKLK